MFPLFETPLKTDKTIIGIRKNWSIDGYNLMELPSACMYNYRFGHSTPIPLIYSWVGKIVDFQA